jgi:hypothetical protein
MSFSMQIMIDVTPDLLVRLEYQISACSYLIAVAGPGVLSSCRYPIEAESLHNLTRVWQALSIMACLNVRLRRAPRTTLSNHASRAYDNRENRDWGGFYDKSRGAPSLVLASCLSAAKRVLLTRSRLGVLLGVSCGRMAIWEKNVVS